MKIMKKSVVCLLTVACLLLNCFSIFVGGSMAMEPPTVSVQQENKTEPKVIYSNETNVSFEASTPSYKEGEGRYQLVLSRRGDVSAPCAITLVIYDNSAQYGADYRLTYAGKAIEKIEGSSSIYNAFRDEGVLSSNLPVDAAEVLVSYTDTSAQTQEDVKASEILATLDEFNACVVKAEIVFAAGESIATVDVEIIDDDESEYGENFIAALLGSDGNVIENSQIMCNIEDNEESPTVLVEIVTSDIDANEESGVAQLEFKRSGNLATGTSALLLKDESPVGYVNFSPYQDKQVAIVLPGKYRLVSEGLYNVGTGSVTVRGEVASEPTLPEGADETLDKLPSQYEPLPYMVQGAPSLTQFPEWAQKTSKVETDDYIIVMGDGGNSLFEKDSSSSDGNVSFLSDKNMYNLNTEGGASQGYLFLRTKDRYSLTGIESIEGSIYIDSLTTGYCDVIFGVWNTDHAKTYTNDNKSLQNLTQVIDPSWGSGYIYYCNSDLPGIWDCGWNAYVPNGFKMNKREYNIRILNPDALEYSGISIAPSIVSDRKERTLTIGSDTQIDIAYDSHGYPVRLVGYKLYNDSTKQYSELISLTDANITFNETFLNKYDSQWAYSAANSNNEVRRTFSILPVFEKVEIEYVIKNSSLGTLKLKNPDIAPCKGDTVVFEGSGNNGFPFVGVYYQARQFADGEILQHGVIYKTSNSDTVSIKIENNCGHYTFQGVYNATADKLAISYGEENPHGKLQNGPGVVLSGSNYRVSDYYPLMADADDGYITVWDSMSNYYFGDIFNYQLDGNYNNTSNDVIVRFLKEGDYITPGVPETKIVLEKGTFAGKLTRNDLNLFDGTVTNIPLSEVKYAITTSHGIHSGTTDENGNFSIENFEGVLGGTYSMSVNYQGRTGYVTFKYEGAKTKYDLNLPQFAVGGFYPVEMTATVSGQGIGSNTLNLTSSGTVQLATKIFIQSDDYKITNVKFHFLSILEENYGHELKVMDATRKENVELDGSYQLWTLDLSETSEVPENTRIYITVTAEVVGSVEVKTYTTTDKVNSGYNVERALKNDDPPVYQDIPTFPGIQSSSETSGTSDFEIPIIGTLDFSFGSKTGGYFVQQGDWNKAGTYTLVCGHSIRPNYMTGTLKDKYKSAKDTAALLQEAINEDAYGIADMKQKVSTDIQVAPIFMIKFTVEAKNDENNQLVHNVIGMEFAFGLEANISKNVPFVFYGVACYVQVIFKNETYYNGKVKFPENMTLGSSFDEFYSKLFSEEREVNSFIAAPTLQFGLKGGLGYNGWASIFAEGTVSAPFIINLSPGDAAGEITVDIAVGAEFIMFSGKFDLSSPPIRYGPSELYDDLTTITDYQNLSTSNYLLANGKQYSSFEEALNDISFKLMERPQANNDLLRAGTVDQSVLAEGVFKNTNIKLVDLGDGKIMALFLMDNRAPEGSLNYLSVAYAISDDNGKTWQDVKLINDNNDSASSSFQYDINVYELNDRMLVTWSEADFDSLIEGIDIENLTAYQIAKLVNAMNLKGRFLDKETGAPMGEAFVIAENSAVFCGALDAVQSGENVYVYYQRTALSSEENVTIEDLLNTQRTIAMATVNVNDTANITTIPVRAMSEEGGQYLISEVEPFVHNGVLGEIIVIDRNGKALSYDSASEKMVSDAEDRQLYLRTYTFDENGIPTTTSLVALTDAADCAQSPQVVSNDEYLYLFWNHNGEIVYAPDFVAQDTDSDIIKLKAAVIVDSNGVCKKNVGESIGTDIPENTEGKILKAEFSPVSIDSDESLHIGTKFTVSMSDNGKVLICWIASDKYDEELIPTDEVYGMMLETKLVSGTDENADNSNENEATQDEEHHLVALGSPVVLTDESRPIGAVDSVCFDGVEQGKFLLAYTRLNDVLRNKSISADIITVTSNDAPKISANVEFVDYPTVGVTEKAYVTVSNEGLHALENYTVTLSGIGEDISVTVQEAVLPGRSAELIIEVPIPESFGADTKLKVSVVGAGEQSQYTATAETDVYFGAYFIPTEIPEVTAIPNSNDCVIKVSVKNIGNKADKPTAEYINGIYASSKEEDVIRYTASSETVISPNGEAVISFTMKDTLIGRGEYSTVQVHFGEGYNQSEEAPMPNPVSLSIEDVTYNPDGNGEDDNTTEDPDAPSTDDGSTDVPSTDVPSTDVPSTDEPSTDDTSIDDTSTLDTSLDTDTAVTEKKTDTKATDDESGCGGCGSSAAISALAIVGVVGSALVIKKKED